MIAGELDCLRIIGLFQAAVDVLPPCSHRWKRSNYVPMQNMGQVLLNKVERTLHVRFFS